MAIPEHHTLSRGPDWRLAPFMILANRDRIRFGRREPFYHHAPRLQIMDGYYRRRMWPRDFKAECMNHH